MIWRLTRLKVFFPLLSLILLFTDGAFYLAFTNVLNIFSLQIVPMGLMVWIAYSVIFNDGENIYFYWWLAAIGLIFDMFYSEQFGTYIFGFLIYGSILNLLYRANSKISYNTLIFITSLAAFIFITYMIGLMSSSTNSSWVEFGLFSGLPTLIFNVIVFAICYLPAQAFVGRISENHIDNSTRRF